jgi:tetratricopeptide (TPR) repeat protein
MQPIEVLTRHLAAAAELELMASPRAQSLIRGRSKSLQAKSSPASLLLDALLMPLNLGWRQTEQQIQIFSLDEVSEEESKQFWMAAADRTLRRFNLAFPGDDRGESALLSRANLKFLQGDTESAANHYQELANQRPKDEMLARLFFNLGKVHLRLGRNEEAIRQFFYAVDQSYDSAFQSTGYWLVGQLLLETHQLEAATKAAGRALATARDDQQKRLAALTMARSYLLNNQPYAANQVLFENRHSFAGSDQQQAAAVLGSYARYVGVTDKNSLNAESNRMLAAVAMASEQSFENFLDIYIAGRAYQELGFQEKAVEKLTLAADSTTILAWRRQFLFELAVQLTISDKLDEAAPVFEFLISGDSDQWHLKSLLQLAQVYVRQQRVQDAIDICESLLARELTDAEKQTTLNTMGRAYRKLGENHSAALCFAGVLPTKTAD